MNIACEYGRYDSAKKIECTRMACPCGHVYFCQLSGTYKQTRQAEDCPVRKPDWKPAEKKKGRSKK